MKNSISLYLSLTIFLIFFFAPQLSGSAQYELVTKKVIIVGGNSAYPPYEFLDKDGNPAGFLVELTRAIAEEQGFEVIIELGESWADMRKALETGEVDILQGISYSEEREKILDFSPPHSFVSHSIFAYEKARPVHSLDELKGKDVILLGRGIMHDYFIHAGIQSNIIPMRTIADAVKLLSTGKYDYAVLATMPANHIISNLKIKNIKTVVKGVETKKYCYAVKKGNHTVLALFNEGMEQMRRTGRYRALQDKWFPAYEIHPLITDYGPYAVILLVSGLVLSLVWSRSLKRLVAIRTADLQHEVEQRKQAVEELKRQQQQLMQADKMATLGILVSGMAHEINNPTGLILLNLPTVSRANADIKKILEDYYEKNGDFIMGGIPYSQMRHEMPLMIDEMHEAAKRIKHIVDDLKHFSRRSDVKYDEEVNINTVVRTSIRLIKNTLKNATYNFKSSLSSELPPVKGNAQRLEQVVVNIILNAAQALQDTSKGIFVSTFYEQYSKSVVIQVCDEGIGIPHEHMQHLTDPFFTTKRETGGTGLGLAISDGIIREHGGSLHFESTPGEGTTVIIRLPSMEKES